LDLIRLNSIDLKRVEAILLLDSVIQVYPNYSETYFNKGNVLTDLTRFKEAFICYNKAIELNPNHVLAYFYKEKALAEMNENSYNFKCGIIALVFLLVFIVLAISNRDMADRSR
jgi:tetratricopeptide (TPR) repeat protein